MKELFHKNFWTNSEKLNEQNSQFTTAYWQLTQAHCLYLFCYDFYQLLSSTATCISTLHDTTTVSPQVAITFKGCYSYRCRDRNRTIHTLVSTLVRWYGSCPGYFSMSSTSYNCSLRCCPGACLIGNEFEFLFMASGAGTRTQALLTSNRSFVSWDHFSERLDMRFKLLRPWVKSEFLSEARTLA
jgi:hypothetical protein